MAHSSSYTCVVEARTACEAQVGRGYTKSAIARAANVDPCTVARVLSLPDEGRVNAATARRLLAGCARLGREAPGRTDAGRCREALGYLRRHGLPVAEVARQVGMPASTMEAIALGEIRTVAVETERAVAMVAGDWLQGRISYGSEARDRYLYACA